MIMKSKVHGTSPVLPFTKCLDVKPIALAWVLSGASQVLGRPVGRPSFTTFKGRFGLVTGGRLRDELKECLRKGPALG